MLTPFLTIHMLSVTHMICMRIPSLWYIHVACSYRRHIDFLAQFYTRLLICTPSLTNLLVSELQWLILLHMFPQWQRSLPQSLLCICVCTCAWVCECTCSRDLGWLILTVPTFEFATVLINTCKMCANMHYDVSLHASSCYMFTAINQTPHNVSTTTSTWN